MKTIRQEARDVPVIEDVDVCVIGGGPSGLPAALAAARRGARTLLVERQGFLGGMATAGLIGPILGHTASRSSEPVLGGIPKELCLRMAELGEAQPWDEALRNWGVAFNPEGFKIVADRLVRESGVTTLFHSFFVDAITEGDRLSHAIIESKSGRQAIAAKVFVDATGDGDVAFRAGAECTKGRPADGKPMAMGSIFHIGGLETLSPEAWEAANLKLAELQRTQDAALYNSGLGGSGSTIRPGFHSVNATRFAGDGTDVRDLTEGEFVTRELAWQALEAWRSVPGAKGLYMAQTPSYVGVRETRQVVGQVVLQGEDVVAGRKAFDGIARASYWIDIHCPRGLTKRGTVHLCSKACPNRDCYMISDHFEELAGELYPPLGDWFDIPLRSLIPVRLDGLVVSGRCISADYQAMSAIRVMGTCLAIGEAAGTAAAMAAAEGISPRELDPAKVRQALAEAGALV